MAPPLLASCHSHQEATSIRTSAMFGASRKLALFKWHDAVQEEGQSVMKHVTSSLYQGGRLRPDYYWQSLYPKDSFETHFTSHQQSIIKSYNPPTNYIINFASDGYDISLHWAIQKKLCGLKQTDLLYRKLNELVNIRNIDSHRTDYSGMSNGELRENLEELLELCMSIFTLLEEYPGDHSRVKMRVVESISNRIHDSDQDGFQATPATTHYPRVTNMSRMKEEEEDDDEQLSSMGKVAVGVGVAGVGILALGALANHLMGDGNNRKPESKKNKTSNKEEEECSVM